MSANADRELCMALMRADSEDGVMGILKDVGYWDDAAMWRLFGDSENNFSTIGNQQSKPDAALVEKLVNSVDARLMNACLLRKIDPEGRQAPKSIREAMAVFFENREDASSELSGSIRYWAPEKHREEAKYITLAATGSKPPGCPCFSIADAGEGQTPDDMPRTFLSLNRTNKIRIHFVQGKFNMGGTGVLQFCGKHNLQFVLSRRNPEVLRAWGAKDPSDALWGFTIVRREYPEHGRRNSVYTYLAPVGADQRPKGGGVLRFAAKAMPIFPEGRMPYHRGSEWGTLVKLYDYSIRGRSHILRKTGVLERFDLLLPEVALPIRLHECRAYGGHEGSPDTTLTGLGVRLQDSKNLEDDYPTSSPLSVCGERMSVNVYAFKKAKAETYRKTEGVLFTVNGQTHAHLTTDFFRRKAVGLSYLSDSLLLIVDCSTISGSSREDLFMNSRDRLRDGSLKCELEGALEDILRNHDGLRSLKDKRRREEIEERLQDSKPLADVLESILKHHPVLSSLFLPGRRVSNPFKPEHVKGGDIKFKGKRYPTYFKFRGKRYGERMQKDCHRNMRCRIAFETDAANDYFMRDRDPGEFGLQICDQANRICVSDYVGPNLHNGLGTLALQVPPGVPEGTVMRYVAVTTDSTQLQPFENFFDVRAIGPEKIWSGGKGTTKPPSREKGKEREGPGGISLPKVKRVRESEWESQTPRPFNRYTALRVKHAGVAHAEQADDEGNVYDFYINVDNVYLRSEMKAGPADPKLTEAKFIYGMVLIGLGLLRGDIEEQKLKEIEETEDDEPAEENIEDRIEWVTRAIAPVLIPTIDHLGALDEESASLADFTGEAT
jgi:hypothetical protein